MAFQVFHRPPWSSLLGNHQIPANQRYNAKHLSGEVTFESLPSRLQITFNVLVQGHLDSDMFPSDEMKSKISVFSCACLGSSELHLYIVKNHPPEVVVIVGFLIQRQPFCKSQCEKNFNQNSESSPTQGWWVASVIIRNSQPAHRHLDARLLQGLVHLAHTLS